MPPQIPNPPVDDIPYSRWIKTPQQRRARETVERVLDVGVELLVEGGFDGLSVAEVCRRADVSPGTLYNRIESKDSLFFAILERELRRISDESRALFSPTDGWSALSTPDLVREAITRLGEQYHADHRLLRAFILRAAVDDTARQIGGRFLGRTIDAVERLLATRLADIPHPDASLALTQALQIVSDALSWRTAFGPAVSGPDIGSDTIDQLAEMCETFLLTPPPAPLRARAG